MKNLLRKYFPNQYRILAAVKGYFRHKQISWSQPGPTPMGFRFNGNAAMEKGQFEPGETKVFTSLLASVDTVINVGANIGYYCCIALHHGKRTVAFEPVPQNLTLLLRNLAANAWEDMVEIYPIAISSRLGILRIYGSGTGASVIPGWAAAPEARSTLVPCSTLDIVIGRRFVGQKCLVLADIEGAERMMLEGATLLLDMDPKPIWLVEIAVSANQPAGTRINPNLMQVFEYFWKRGYLAWTTHNSNRLVTVEEVQAIIDGGPDTLWGDTFLFAMQGDFSPAKLL